MGNSQSSIGDKLAIAALAVGGVVLTVTTAGTAAPLLIGGGAGCL